jgi:hypothetical protein
MTITLQTFHMGTLVFRNAKWIFAYCGAVTQWLDERFRIANAQIWRRQNKVSIP